MKGMAYFADILRPTKSPTDGGREGKPEVLGSKWPCSVVSGGGREVVIAQQISPLVTHVVKGMHPGCNITPLDYLIVDGKRLDVEFVDATANYGAVVTLRCIEKQ